jgi:hypothetical protein
MDRGVGVRAGSHHIVRKRLELEASLYQILQILSLLPFEKVPILCCTSATYYSTLTNRFCSTFDWTAVITY